MEYYDIYLKRLNRYGNDFLHRIQGEREEEFEYLLKKSVYRVDFEYKENMIPGVFTPYRQNETKVLHYLMTRNKDNLDSGTILWMPKLTQEGLEPWMVYWQEEIAASGYRKYTMLKMTHFIEWTDREGKKQTTWAYLYGQEDNMLKDELKSRSRMDALYVENLKMNFFIAPLNENIQKEDYFTLREGKLKKGYVVKGFDIDSTSNIEYVSVDPVYLHDESPDPYQTPDESSDDFFWIRGGHDELWE